MGVYYANEQLGFLKPFTPNFLVYYTCRRLYSSLKSFFIDIVMIYLFSKQAYFRKFWAKKGLMLKTVLKLNWKKIKILEYFWKKIIFKPFIYKHMIIKYSLCLSRHIFRLNHALVINDSKPVLFNSAVEKHMVSNNIKIVWTIKIWLFQGIYKKSYFKKMLL